MSIKRIFLAITISLVIIGVGSAAAITFYQTTQETIHSQTVQTAQAIGDNLYLTVREGMTSNNHAGVRQIVADAVGSNDVVQVRVLGLNGKVYADSGWELQGEFIPKEVPGCVECHRNEVLPESVDLNFLPGWVRVATPIPNETTCLSCHNVPNSPSLGVVLVDVSVARCEAIAFDDLRLQLAGVVGAGVVVGWVVAGFPGWKWQPACPLRRLAWEWPAWKRPFSPLHHPLFLGVLGSLGLVLVGSSLFVTQVEQKNEFCASCHTEPETTYYQRTLHGSNDLATAHAAEGVACVECHSGAGAMGRVDTLALGAKNLALFVSGNYQTPTTAETSINTDHCTKCHQEVLTELSVSNHFHYFVPQWGQPTACVACHASHPTDGDPEASFTAVSAIKPACESCHQEVSR